jgi:L-ascorbate metabolism protein UlaG (beta-lactamase superfamily)
MQAVSCLTRWQSSIINVIAAPIPETINMTRSILAFTLLAAFTAPASAKKITIKWHGQSFFEIRSDAGTVIAIDPHNIDGYGRREVKADAVLMSHFHIDHTAPEPITNIMSAKKIVGLKNPKGVGGSRKDDEFNEVDEKVKDVQVKSIASYHDKLQGMMRGKNGIFILEIDGLRIVHLGDLGHELTRAQVKAIGEVDVLMIPVGGIYTLNGQDAKKVVEQLQPKRFVIPMHYGTRVYDYVLSEEEFLDEQDEKFIKKFKHNELIVDTEEAARRKPIIALLHWEPKEEEKKDEKKDDR